MPKKNIIPQKKYKMAIHYDNGSKAIGVVFLKTLPPSESTVEEVLNLLLAEDILDKAEIELFKQLPKDWKITFDV